MAETVVATGANRGIGLGLARLYAEAGATVIAGCRSPEKARDLEALARDHDGVRIAALDVTDPASVASFADGIEAPVDILINNAGVWGGEPQALDAMDYGGWEEALAVNTMGPLRVIQALMPALKKAGRPRVVTVSSQMGALSGTSTGSLAYRTSKAAVNKLMQTLAAELAEDGIIALPLHPGWVRTDMGGSNADISVEESAAGIKEVIDGLSPAQSGRFLNWKGEELSW